jgi:hypothetical protein
MAIHHTVRWFYCIVVSVLAVNYENDERLSELDVHAHKSSSFTALKLDYGFCVMRFQLL